MTGAGVTTTGTGVGTGVGATVGTEDGSEVDVAAGVLDGLGVAVLD